MLSIDVSDETLMETAAGPTSLDQRTLPSSMSLGSPAIEMDDDGNEPGRATPSGTNWKKHVWKVAEDETLHHLVATTLNPSACARALLLLQARRCCLSSATALPRRTRVWDTCT